MSILRIGGCGNPLHAKCLCMTMSYACRVWIWLCIDLWAGCICYKQNPMCLNPLCCAWVHAGWCKSVWRTDQVALVPLPWCVRLTGETGHSCSFPSWQQQWLFNGCCHCSIKSGHCLGHILQPISCQMASPVQLWTQQTACQRESDRAGLPICSFSTTGSLSAMSPHYVGSILEPSGGRGGWGCFLPPVPRAPAPRAVPRSSVNWPIRRRSEFHWCRCWRVWQRG